ncbi:hypothetical protein H4R99_000679 [Coemansia sp. RSA 1722]|nr:hypothetical protein LPJ57_000158 [Coemansia sp. RSA 486]KAJ2237792.1 hypothetical protein IWW45_000680 [Coemansia sp. RSA 485]KAJ2602454.1 hypothetical protein GGF39_000662 [Coemansia sp. RSA 1721]KAJ2605977.1 hypothetical protein H4R99_000679 [Coemansia sp. RSA 1722]KAJ2639635.1 hypothetical protein GGF40_000750 [Coemansia sp. RSA 1286]
MADFNIYANQAFGGNQMPYMGYTGSIMGAPTGAEQQQMSMFGAYGNSGHISKSVSNQPAAPGTQTFSSQVLSDNNSFVYCYDEASGTNVEHNVRQMVASDMSVFIEHMPGYNLVYVPVGCSIDMATNQMMGANFSMPGNNHGGPRKNNGRGNARAQHVVEKTSKPSNAFIMYRNHKIEELRKQMPDINQIEISREAGKWWRNETEEVKKHFQDKYREEKLAYDLKKSKRSRADSSAAFSDDFGDDIAVSTPKKKKTKTSRNGYDLGLGSGGAKQRSQTLPTNMFNNSNARLDITTDLRKQMAARNTSTGSSTMSGSSYLDGNTPNDSPYLHHPYADLTSSGALGQHNSTSSMQTLVSSQDASQFMGNVSSVQMFQNTSMGDIDNNDHSGMANQNSVLAASAHMGDSSDLTQSLVGAGLPVGIQMSHDDLAAAASMAASAAMASNTSFYTADATTTNDDGSQWAQSMSGYAGINPADTHNISAADVGDSVAASVPALTTLADSN